MSPLTSGSRIAAIAILAAIALGGCASQPRLVVQPAGAPYDSAATNEVAPGVVHRRLIDAHGPYTINVLEVGLRRRGLTVRAAHALDSLRGRELTSAIARRAAASGGETVAAVNADFFDLKTGENENNQIIDGEVVKAVAITDSPFDSLHTIHSQFGLRCDGRPVMDRFAFDGTIITAPPATAVFPLNAVNFRPRGDATVLYTSRAGTTPAADSIVRSVVDLPLRATARRGDTVVYRVDGAPHSGGGLSIPSNGAALTGFGASAELLRRLGGTLSVGAELRVYLGFKPNRGRLCTLVGGWPRIVVDGASVAADADRTEGTFPRFSVTKHPRTGVGFSRDSSTLFLVTVDGRQESSSGMSLVELAELMRSLGVFQGLNLDGGGSTTMVIRGAIANQPSDSTGERPVGNAILVMRGRR